MIRDIRFRPTNYTKKVISNELYEKWRKTYPEYSKYTFKQFKELWGMLASEYKNIVVSNSHGIRLPFYMGDISLKYVMSSQLNRNYVSSEKASEPVGHLNLITSGKNGKIVWSVDYARKFNAELPLIGFQSCRNFTTMAANSFKENPELFRIAKVSKGNIEAILLKHHPNYFRKNADKRSNT